MAIEIDFVSLALKLFVTVIGGSAKFARICPVLLEKGTILKRGRVSICIYIFRLTLKTYHLTGQRGLKLLKSRKLRANFTCLPHLTLLLRTAKRL